ncbi:MAG: phytanoyl-CoA dioxygenase family protein [Pseudomonadota bacterium]
MKAAPTPPPNIALSELQIEQFNRDGFLVVRQLADANTCDNLLSLVRTALNPPLAPLEYEADVHYPGSPASIESLGGRTPRRLLHAYARDAAFRDWAANPKLLGVLRQLIGSDQIQLTQNHHNCVMTKFPSYSSETHWHQDIRYWSFDRPELVNAWLALGRENTACGGMQMVPGSHKFTIDRGRFDASMFLRTDLADNQELLKTAVSAELNSGDVLLFHCRTFHAAGANTTDAAKFSLVFSYHARDNAPIPETRSARYPEVDLSGSK